MSEWLRSVTRNHMGSARTGSNPVVDDILFSFEDENEFFFYNFLTFSFLLLILF
jgi:hypothetical protein